LGYGRTHPNPRRAQRRRAAAAYHLGEAARLAGDRSEHLRLLRVAARTASWRDLEGVLARAALARIPQAGTLEESAR